MTPPSPEHDTAELELLMVTISMIIATLGYASPDLAATNARAQALAEKTGNLGHLAEQIYGSFWAAIIAGNYRSAMALADRLLDVARRDGGACTRGLVSSVQLISRFYTGDLPGAEEHFAAGEALLSDPGLRRYSVAARTLCFLAGMPGSPVGPTRREHECSARSPRSRTMHMPGRSYS
jgi:hypothetical protein